MRGKVLIVDDDPVIRRLARAGLASDCEVVEVASLQEARAAFERESPGLVLLDISLPDGDGTELIGPFSRVPVVILTSNEDIDAARSALAKGASEYLTKPFEPADLQQVARRWLRLPGERPEGDKPWRRAQ